MQRLLVIGDTRGISLVLNELTRMQIDVAWAVGRKEALDKIGKNKIFDAVIIDAENGLSEADALAAEVKMTAENLPVVIAAKEGPLDKTIQTGLGLGNIDAVIPELLVVSIIEAYDQIKSKHGL